MHSFIVFFEVNSAHINFLITEVIMDFGRERFLLCFREDK